MEMDEGDTSSGHIYVLVKLSLHPDRLIAFETSSRSQPGAVGIT
jgi:hypothetical protein